MILQQLKEQTRELHERVEQAVDITSRLSSEANYIQLLADFFGIYKPLEQRLRVIPQLQGPTYDFTKRLKVELLASDLLALGNSQQEISALPRCDVAWNLSTTARGLGCLYVLEGAALGGQVIAAEVRRRLPRMAEAALSFFTGDGQQTSIAWQAFRQHLIGYVEDHSGCEAEVIEAAKETFITFERWFVRS